MAASRTEIIEGLHVIKLSAQRGHASMVIPRELCADVKIQAGVDRLLMGSVGDAIVIFKADTINPDAVQKEFDAKVDRLTRDWVATFPTAVSSTKEAEI